MAETPEGRVKRWLRAEMAKAFPNAYHYAPPGSRYGKRGTPDDVWWIPCEMSKLGLTIGLTVAIEAKADENEPTALQAQVLEWMEERGVLAFELIGRDEYQLNYIMGQITQWQSLLRRVDL